MATALAFHRDMLAAALAEDCLVVAAKGLGGAGLVVRLVQVACGSADAAASVAGISSPETKKKRRGPPLVFVVNASDEAEVIRSAVARTGGLETSCTPPTIVTNVFTSQERTKMYQAGGCFIVTSRILVVDLLSNVADPAHITGVIVQKAHRITEKSNEAFILNILRSTPSFEGFVKAFTDSPESLAGKFGFLSQVMGTLGVRKVHLWPRFHVSVRNVLDAARPEVVELSQPLSRRMLGIQSEIVTAIDMCLNELKQTQNIDVSGFTVEDGLFRSFEVTLRRQLDPIWHKVSRKTRQLVFDVGVLRRLLPDLLRFDSVSFLRVLDNIREESISQSVPSLWMLTDAADRLFSLAKQRVFKAKVSKNKKKHKSSAASADPIAFDPNAANATVLDDARKNLVELSLVLEENPKLGLLRQILGEVQQTLATSPSPPGQFGTDVLVLCRDERTCDELQQYLYKDPAALRQRRFESYLAHRFARFCESNGLKHLLEPSAASDSAALLRLQRDLFEGSLTIVSSAGASSTEPSKAAGSAEHLKGSSAGASSSTSGASKAETGGDAGGAGGTSGGGTRKYALSMTPEQRLLLVEYVRRRRRAKQLFASREPSQGPVLKTASERASLARANTIIFPFEGEKEQLSILEELRPRFIVLFDPDVRVVREIEVFQAAFSENKVTVYFLQYEESVEEQKYLSDLKREQDMFRKLIDEKAGLVLPVAERNNATAIVEQTRIKESTIIGYNLSTGEPLFAAPQRPHGKAGQPIVPVVVVDMREFRSALPAMLHKHGVMVAPTTLEVGDYILAPEICVERKSIPDLHQSFSSGRLFTQAEAMCRYYARPNLLIEFDENKPFSLQSAADLSGEISVNSILSKMVLLALHFPRLRFLWSPSTTSSVELFKLMKANYNQPEPTAAAKVGIPDLDDDDGDNEGNEAGAVEPKATAKGGPGSSEADGGGSRVEAPKGNVAAQELLRRLPGITVHNYGKVLSKVRSLRDLSEMSLPGLVQILGKINGKKLFEFFNEVPPDAAPGAGATLTGPTGA